MNLKKNKINFIKFLCYIFFCISIVFIIIRCFYGINFDDELAYISVVKRMMNGQWVILDDWNAPTILSSWLTYQMVRFTGIFKVESIVIAFRCLYILFQCTVSLILYRWFQKEKWCPIAILIYLYATPYNINTLSYNTLSIGFMMLLCGYILSRTVWKKKEYILVGVIFSLCVLSNPYVILIYFVYVVCIIGFMMKKKKEIQLFSIAAFYHISLGAFIIFIVFISSMLSHGTLKEYITNGILLLNDAEHSSKSNLFVQIGEAIYQIFRVYWRMAIPMLLITGATICCKKLQQYRRILFALSIVFTAYGIIRFSFIYGSVYPNLMLVAINFIGVETYLLTKNKPKKIFWGWYILGIIFAICIHVGTNTGILSGSAAFVVPSVATVLLLLKLCSELNVKWLGYLLIVLELSCVYWLRLSYVWADGEMQDLRFQIKEGPCKYLYTSEESFVKYNSMMELVKDINVQEQESVLFMPMRPLYYLATNGQYATPYTKRFLVSFIEVENYFKENAEGLPDVIIYGQDGEEEELGEIEKVWDWFRSKGYEEVLEDNDYRKLVKW